MNKSAIYVFLLLVFTSCRTYNMLDGKSRPVYLTPDSSVFNDSDYTQQKVHYQDLLNIRGNFTNSVDLKEGKTSFAIIHQPTFFNSYDEFLVYPGEHITIKKGKYNDMTFLKKSGSKRRNRELSFFKTFQQKVRSPMKSMTGLSNYSIDTILVLERQLKIELPIYSVQAQQLFDSLAKALRVSGKFKKIGGNYVKSKFSGDLFMFYRSCRDTLEAHRLFRDKCKRLIPAFNGITDKGKFEGVYLNLNELADVVLPYKIHRINSESEFKSCFDSTELYFNGLAREYLLSRLLYSAHANSIEIPGTYMTKYEMACSDRTFKKIIDNVRFQKEESNNKVTSTGNSLLSVDGRTVTSLENLITKSKGKLIFIDFWATWCVPCRKEMPSLIKLIKEYPEDKIVFLTVSIDKEMQYWQKNIIANNTEIKNNYLLIEQEKSSFVKKYGINSIPRYMLVDKQGQIISPEAPNPSDPKLKELIDKSME